MNHNKVIAQEAKHSLKPLGFVRSGKSRLWYKDNGWWAVVVEFQPSSFSKGTYVNVSVSHFLYESNSWAFHIPQRLPGFASAEDEGDFEAKVRCMAEDARDIASDMLEKYSSIESFVKWYTERERRHVWIDYYSAMFNALAGDYERCGIYLEAVCNTECERTWEFAVQHRARDLLFFLKDPREFRRSVLGIVIRTRSMMNLIESKTEFEGLPWAET